MFICLKYAIIELLRGSFFSSCKFSAGVAVQRVPHQRQQDVHRPAVRQGGTDRVLLVQGDPQHHRGHRRPGRPRLVDRHLPGPGVDHRLGGHVERN